MEIAGQKPESNEIMEFEYRKLFSLSHDEFMDEPFEIYQTNLDILRAKRLFSDRKSRTEARKIK